MANFADVQYCIHADNVGGWVRKSPNYADVIYVWPLAVVNLVSWVGFHSIPNPILSSPDFSWENVRVSGFHSAPLLQINTVQFIPFLNLEYSFTLFNLDYLLTIKNF